MYNYVHLDEKWFYLSESSVHYYLRKDEESPERSCRNKNFITKVIFLVAVARPRFDTDGDVIFDGKLGLWPFIEKVAAKKNSKNRPKGTMETKSVNVDRKMYKKMLLDKVLPSIFSKWPAKNPWKIKAQHDNAPAHVPDNDENVIAAGNRGRTTVELVSQPPNSPDFNVLDLGMFAGVGSLQYKTAPRTVDELVNEVLKAYQDYEPRSIDDNFLNLQKVMESSMHVYGGNTYKMPHMKKSHHRNIGKPIKNVVCDPETYNLALNTLNEDNI